MPSAPPYIAALIAIRIATGSHRRIAAESRNADPQQIEHRHRKDKNIAAADRVGTRGNINRSKRHVEDGVAA
jgi:hypothetical protein